jgi:D-glycero-alpha-D-manno-heptose 1-phosphate guanylyltransferase
MEAIILAGGLGTRLRSTVPDVPKSMAPIAGRPFLEILLAALSDHGFCRVVLSVGYMANAIVSHFGDRFAGLELAYAIECSPLGTGGATRNALGHCYNDHVFVFNGDTIIALEVSEVEAMWTRLRRPVIVGREVPDMTRYGRLEASDGLVHSLSEKAGTGAGIANAGCYLFPVNLLDAFEVGKPFSLERDFLAHAVKRQPFQLYVTHGNFIDIGVPEDFARAQTELEP